MVVEGLNALPAMIELRDKYNVDMPITTAVADVVAGRLTPQEALEALYARALKAE